MCENTALQALFDGTLRNAQGQETRAMLVYGAPNTGKTSFAVRAAVAGCRRWPQRVTAMVVQNRTLAASIDASIIRELGVSRQSRPVGTLASLAFRIISAYCKSQHKPAPKLLNGAEQDALLRKVVRSHVQHVERGDNGDCAVCALLQEYFGTPSWVGTLTCGGEDGANVSATSVTSATATSVTSAASATSVSSTYATVNSQLEISNAFMHQLRDMIARLDELGVGDAASEQAVFAALDSVESTISSSTMPQVRVLLDRRRTQWRLAFALRAQYREALASAYAGSFRLDTSQLLVEGVKAAKYLQQSAEMPVLLVVDDFQDITLAGLSFVETLVSLGTRVVLLANPDESVQAFRGAYPDYSVTVAVEGPLRAAEYTLSQLDKSGQLNTTNQLNQTNQLNTTSQLLPTQQSSPQPSSQLSAPTMRDILSARVSLSLTSQHSTDVALPNRPWKTPIFAGTLPVVSLKHLNNSAQSSNTLDDDGTVCTALYRSQREELDAVLWHIKREHMVNRRRWSDMALIAHDNATVRLFGEQLRQDGVPVRYSLVTRPLKDEPFVQGLFALMELAYAVQRGMSGIVSRLSVGNNAGDLLRPESSATSANLSSLALWVRSRVNLIMESPLASVHCADMGLLNSTGAEIPAKLGTVEALLRSLASLAAVIESDALAQSSPLLSLMQLWDDVRAKLLVAARERSAASQVLVDNRLVEDSNISNAGNSSNAGDNSNAGNSGNAGNNSGDLHTLSLDACYMLCFVQAIRYADGDGASDGEHSTLPQVTVLSLLKTMAPHNPHVQAFAKVWDWVQQLASAMRKNSDLLRAKYALGEAWKICNVDKRWQRTALQHNREGYCANDRLDAAMRLFDYVSAYDSADSSDFVASDFADFADSSDSVASDSEYSADSSPSRARSSSDIADFIAQVRGMEIEADSLAHVAPHPDAVTLTTPAGAVGKHWPLVWMPTVQQRVWPNLAPRSTMFGAESLANVILASRQRSINATDLAANDKASVFAGEQRSFLLAVTRATECLHLSAQYSDSAVPSDFLYYYLPERYYNNEDSRTPFTEFTLPFAGLDMDVRGLVCAARSKIARAEVARARVETVGCEGVRSCADVPSCEAVVDAAQALQLLSDNGVECANPKQWGFMNDITEDAEKFTNCTQKSEKVTEESEKVAKKVTKNTKVTKNIETEESASRSVVSLSPSAVDSLWACPVCGLLSRQLAGPQKGSVATYVGTLIHETARWASENQHYDLPETKVEETCAEASVTSESSYSPYVSKVRRINAIAQNMADYYASIAPELADIRDTRERYSALARQTNIMRALTAIAQYLVTAYDQSTYQLDAQKSDSGMLQTLSASRKTISNGIGTLQKAYCELPTSAHFGFDDVTKVLNNTLQAANLPTMQLSDVIALMGALVGGWPDGVCDDLQVHIHGRIDRMETRTHADGSTSMRVLDYKTGKALSASGVFNDLQLVCYQLALVFADEKPLISNPHAPTIARSMLFHVVYNDTPAQDHNVAENVYQPPLFVGNMLNNNPPESRVGFKTMSRLFDNPQREKLLSERPEGVSEQAWQSFRCLSETAQWSLNMIARVCYAAAVVRSQRIVAHPTSQHVQYCRSQQVCPACAGRLDTVYEVRQS
ncbi:PD-(D/E)XK nuclease family protein [Gardnerella sp. Marseille-Q2328]|uniref:PD-(D/E)XK nuclease family protein n=1 Tax=Gardnerella sp. Marseille-Q2328 TaxID=2759694 RepID=UPI002024AC42|nr:PD-(D/E)XK nuclease family protein [Gardnerella sp. Marseille-Q2328]